LHAVCAADRCAYATAVKPLRVVAYIAAETDVAGIQLLRHLRELGEESFAIFLFRTFAHMTEKKLRYTVGAVGSVVSAAVMTYLVTDFVPTLPLQILAAAVTFPTLTTVFYVFMLTPSD
jgi:hypothetical protein